MRRLFVALVVLGLLVVAALIAVPAMAVHRYGSPSPALSSAQVFQYSARLLWDDGLLTRPLNPHGAEQSFTVVEGESIESMAGRLQATGAIRDAGALRDYLLYTGLDTSVQAGKYKISPALSIVDIAHLVQDATPSDVTLVVWPGWRLEEIAEALPTSGLDITPEAFEEVAASAQPDFTALAGVSSAEGFLFPDSYVLPRTTGVHQLVHALLSNFSLHVTKDLTDGFTRQSLTLYQAVTLASIVQRESMQASEAPMIASVYLNRLRMGMKLDADPTVQYALGYNALQGTWWTNPLSAGDLQFSSPYNTYVTAGLPPTPISNPGLDALRAVAEPAESDYLYFSARCDGSGLHQFARTFEEHLSHLCP